MSDIFGFEKEVYIPYHRLGKRFRRDHIFDEDIEFLIKKWRYLYVI